MTHDQLMTEVLQRIPRAGLLVYGMRAFWVPSSAAAGIRLIARGWPDLTIAGPGGFIFREVKSDYDETTPEQDAWAWLLSREDLPQLPLGRRGPLKRWAIWQPADLHSGRIDDELLLIAGQPLT